MYGPKRARRASPLHLLIRCQTGERDITPTVAAALPAPPNPPARRFRPNDLSSHSRATVRSPPIHRTFVRVRQGRVTSRSAGADRVPICPWQAHDRQDRMFRGHRAAGVVVARAGTAIHFQASGEESVDHARSLLSCADWLRLPMPGLAVGRRAAGRHPRESSPTRVVARQSDPEIRGSDAGRSVGASGSHASLFVIWS